MLRIGIFLFLVLLETTATARAQAAPGGCRVWVADSQAMISINQNHYRLLRNVSVECNDMQFYADEAEVFNDADRVRAWGNVLFVSTNNRISAERMDFNTRTRTGTFYVASGIANMENRGIDRSLFGTQEPDAYFYGETIEKLGPKTYRITRGGFTTCVQPTPRWELVSGSVTMTLDDHAFLKNSVLKVKGVPMMYLPVFYYPINKEDRATGFLIPTYGNSTLRGHTISNAFFWAINRSHDATFFYDWMSKTGQQFGTEYRYIQGPGAHGNIQYTNTQEHPTTYDQPDGSVRPVRRRRQLSGERDDDAAAAAQFPARSERRLFLEPGRAAAQPAEPLSGDIYDAAVRRQPRRQLGRLHHQQHDRADRGPVEQHDRRGGLHRVRSAPTDHCVAW